MAKIIGTIEVQTQRCKGCSICVVSCPTQAISLSKFVNDKGYNYCELSEPEKCIGCAGCGQVCPDACITVYRKKLN